VRKTLHATSILFIFLTMAIFPVLSWADQSSTDYLISVNVLSNGVGNTSSADRLLSSTIGQSSATGASISDDYKNYAGFWYDTEYDSRPPTIINVTSLTANGAYSIGTDINITLNFSESVSSSGLTINLNSGASITTDSLNNVTSYSGTYRVVAGETSVNLSVSSIIGTITDAASNSTTDPSIPVGQNIGDSKHIIIDTIAPTSNASPRGGTYTSEQSVTLTCNDGAGSGCGNIYYTTNGFDPTKESSVYIATITISTNTTLKFFAVDLAGNSEDIKAESYIIQSALPLAITTTSLPSGDLDLVYSGTLAATGGVLPYSWSISSGNLPNGLTLNSSTGSISGTPTETGIFDFTGRVTDANSSNAYKNLSITVLSYPVRISSPRTYYLNIQNAYDACFTGNVIQIGATDFTEDLYCDRDLSIILKGGYDSNYSNNSSYTIINGTLTISNGTVIVDRLIIK
jgi:hypothetical protein